MARVPYLQRRDNGVYYLQVRFPALTPAGPRFLLRFSLGTREFLDARRFVVARLALVVPIMSTYTLKDRMDGATTRLAILFNQPVLDDDDFQSRLVFEHVGRHVMQEINRGLPGTPPPEGFLVFSNLFTSFVQSNIEREKVRKTDTSRSAYGTGLTEDTQSLLQSRVASARHLEANGWIPLVHGGTAAPTFRLQSSATDGNSAVPVSAAADAAFKTAVRSEPAIATSAGAATLDTPTTSLQSRNCRSLKVWPRLWTEHQQSGRAIRPGQSSCPTGCANISSTTEKRGTTRRRIVTSGRTSSS